jgi:hypothetical protein
MAGQFCNLFVVEALDLCFERIPIGVVSQRAGSPLHDPSQSRWANTILIVDGSLEPAQYVNMLWLNLSYPD